MDNSIQNAQNVISMSNHLPHIGFTAIAQIDAYWEALRAGRLLPKRSEIDPRGVEQALENAFVLERIAVGVARFRVAGSHLNALMGMEVRGMPLTSFFAPNQRRMVGDALEEVFQTPAKCRFTMQSPGGGFRPTLEAQLILLPLKSDLGDVSRALGCLVAKGRIGAAPRRFDIVGHQLTQLTPDPENAPAIQPAQPLPLNQDFQDAQPGFQESKEDFAPKNNKARPPYLRLIKSDD